MKTIIIDGIEYNLTPKVPFKKGDFVVIQETTYLISKIEGLNITLSLNGRECIFDIDVLKNAHLWTIQDAKDGDVLFTSSTASHETFIFKSIDEKGNAKCYFAYDSEDGFREGKYHFIGRATDCKPATKEQRDLLFQKMKEAGYEWDAEKKELRKIEQNPAWSEEDEEMLRRCISATFDHGYLKECDWLKSLKERYTWKPSDEQIISLDTAIAWCIGDKEKVALKLLLSDLKKLKG